METTDFGTVLRCAWFPSVRGMQGLVPHSVICSCAAVLRYESFSPSFILIKTILNRNWRWTGEWL